MSGDSWWASNRPTLHQLCFSLSLCPFSMHSTLWPLNCPFFFLRSAGLIAKWAVCKHTSHTTNTRVSTHRRGPLEGNQNTTWNFTKKIKCQQAATHSQDPPTTCSPCHCFWKVYFLLKSLLKHVHSAQLHFLTSFSPRRKPPQPLLPTTFLLAFLPSVLSTDSIQGITDQGLFKARLYACFHLHGSQEDFGIVLDYFKTCDFRWSQATVGQQYTLLDAALSVMLTLQPS